MSANLPKSTIERGSSQFKTLFAVLYQERTAIYALLDRYQDVFNEQECKDVAHLLMRETCLHLHRKILVLYPLVAERLPNGVNIGARCRLDQTAIETVLVECERLQEDSGEYRDKLREAMRLFQQLNTYEESQVLPALEKAMSTDEAVQKAKEYQALISTVGTRPHPNASTMLPKAIIDQQNDAIWDHMSDKGRFAATTEKSHVDDATKCQEYHGEPSKHQPSAI